MKKAISVILSFIFILSCMFVLSSCHGKKKTVAFDVPATFDESKTYEITFWAKNDSNVTQRKIYEKAIVDFQAIYPNIKVTMKSYNDYSRIYNDVITNIPTQTTPNVCITYPDNVATYITGENVVVPLESLINDSKYGLGGSEVKFESTSKDEIYSKFLNEGVVNGIQYCIPFMRSSEACYINKDLVEKLGYEIPEKLTWDFIWEVSEKAMEKDADGNYKVNGQKTLIPFIYKSTDNMMIQMLRQKGYAYSTDDAQILIFNDDTESLLFDLAEECKKNVFSTFKISSYPGNFLNANQCIFAIDSTAGATWMGTNAHNQDIPEDQIVKFEIVVKEVPQFDVENPKMISQGPSICVFNKEDPNEVLASWLFAQYLLTNEVQINYAQTEGYVPVTSKARETDEYKDYLNRSGENNDLYYSVKIDATKLLLENIENTFITPVFNGSASLRDAAGSLIESVVKSIRRKETIDEAYMEKLFSDTNSLYRLDQLSAGTSGKRTLPALPTESKILLISICVIWTGIISFFAYKTIKTKKNK